MDVLEFKYISTKDDHSMHFYDGQAWSRPYEYKIVLNYLENLKKDDECKIHNTSWGFDYIHLLFKTELDKNYKNTIHSDIREPQFDNCIYYDIRSPPQESMVEEYDFVINVSTLEEVNYDHVTIFKNLFTQVKPGGYLICTFDLPGLDIHAFESLFEMKIKDSDTRISGFNSVVKNQRYENLNCGLLVVKKLL